MSFEQALSGLNAASQSLDLIGNNIANANSAGFKAGSAQFSDLFANSLTGGSATDIGIGTQLSQIVPQFTQGNITVTSNPLDIAINGKGFFRLSESGVVSYSRAGQFNLDKSGFVTNGKGLRLTGYLADYAGTIVASSPVDLQISQSALAPVATTKVTAQFSLDSREAVPVTPVFSVTDPTTYNNSSSISVFDSLGNPHVVSLYFVKAAAPNSWNMYGSSDGTSAANVDLGAGAGNPLPLTFNTSGILTTVMPASMSLDLNGVATALGKVNGAVSPQAFTLQMVGSTQFGSDFGVNSLDQDGYPSGTLSGLGVGNDGIIEGRYSNGRAKNLGQVVLVNFNNNQALKPLGNSLYGETPESGIPLIGTPATGTFGVLQSAAIEDSNVDLTAELVHMITMQRVYQANAQSIKTQDQVTQTLVNLR